MNISTAIKFGAFAKKVFNLPDGFDVLLVPENWRAVRVPIPEQFQYKNIPSRAEFEELNLSLYVTGETENEIVETWAAYAERSRVLVIACESNE